MSEWKLPGGSYSIRCGVKITEKDYQALNQTERKRLGELVKEMRSKDKLTPEFQLRERAYYRVMAESIEYKPDYK